MNFLQLQYFRTVAEMEHISNAAAALYISQPALSKTIRTLEHEIGYPLFDREGTRIHLNENGRILYRYAVEALTAMDKAAAQIADRNDGNHRVTMSVAAATHFLPEMIMGIREAFPEVQFCIKQEDYREPQHTCDLYLHSAVAPVQSENEMTLLSEVCLLGLSTEHPLAGMDHIAPAMLREETFLTMPSQLPLYHITQDMCEAAGFAPNTMQFDNRETIFDLINANMGVSIVPERTWAPYIHRRKIVVRPLTVSYYRHIVLYWPKERYLSEDGRRVVTYLREYFQSLQVR